jgi:hypothetical protein
MIVYRSVRTPVAHGYREDLGEVELTQSTAYEVFFREHIDWLGTIAKADFNEIVFRTRHTSHRLYGRFTGSNEEMAPLLRAADFYRDVRNGYVYEGHSDIQMYLSDSLLSTAEPLEVATLLRDRLRGITALVGVGSIRTMPTLWQSCRWSPACRVRR